MDLLTTLRQRQHALTLPNWAWTGSAKGMVWQEIQDAIDHIEALRAELAGQADASLSVWNRAIKAETDNDRLRAEVARLTLERLQRASHELDSVVAGATADGGRHADGPNMGRTEVCHRGRVPGASGTVQQSAAA